MRTLSTGEILFDVFPDCERIGGAPLNAAAHIAALGGDSYIVSAVGGDELGKRAIAEIGRMGVSTEFVRISGCPTGRADITLRENGDADYEFNSPCAWDDISLTPDQLDRILSVHWDCFIFGTLSSRSGTSADTLSLLLDNVDAGHFFFDVNFRKDFYSKDMILKALQKTTILKVNEDELPIILTFTACENVPDLIERYDLGYVLLTLGERGSTLYTRTETIHEDIVPGPVTDTVGAGDSLSAAFMFFLDRDGNERTALAKAGTVASFVVSQKGAVPGYPEELLESLML